MTDQLFYIITGVIGATGIWWLYFVEYKNYRVDDTRQRLFAIRDLLFQQAEEGKVSFNSRAYQITRTTLNGMIRFTHDLSFLRLLISFISYKIVDEKDYVERYGKELFDSINELPKPEQKIILGARLSMHFAVVAHVFRSSIIMVILESLIRLFLQSKRATYHIKRYFLGKRTRARWNILDAEANEIGTDCR